MAVSKLAYEAFINTKITLSNIEFTSINSAKLKVCATSFNSLYWTSFENSFSHSIFDIYQPQPRRRVRSWPLRSGKFSLGICGSHHLFLRLHLGNWRRIFASQKVKTSTSRCGNNLANAWICVFAKQPVCKS